MEGGVCGEEKRNFRFGLRGGWQIGGEGEVKRCSGDRMDNEDGA